MIFHISIDGFRADMISALGEKSLKTLFKIRKDGAFTDNARTDHNITITLPNHTGMLTSLPFKTIIKSTMKTVGHGVYFNKDYTDMNIHMLNNNYTYSIFNTLFNNNKTGSMYVNKEKFTFIYKSYKEYIKKFFINPNNNIGVVPIIKELINDIKNGSASDYNFIHYGQTDKMGHKHGWNSKEYKEALMNIDYNIGVLINVLDNLKKEYYIIITTDHGFGGPEKTAHHDITNKVNFTIPYYVYKNGGLNLKNNDLYSINLMTRKEPSANVNPNYNGMQPIRNSDTGNFVLSLFGLPPIKNSIINNKQDLSLS
jgi:predicted AlkP superfamily pyrophosphatase or phosphodiesterase